MCKQEETEQPSNIPSKIRSRRCMVVRNKNEEIAIEDSSVITSTEINEHPTSGYARLDPLEMINLDPAYGKDSISIDEIDTKEIKK